MYVVLTCVDLDIFFHLIRSSFGIRAAFVMYSHIYVYVLCVL